MCVLEVMMVWIKLSHYSGKGRNVSLSLMSKITVSSPLLSPIECFQISDDGGEIEPSGELRKFLTAYSIYISPNSKVRKSVALLLLETWTTMCVLVLDVRIGVCVLAVRPSVLWAILYSSSLHFGLWVFCQAQLGIDLAAPTSTMQLSPSLLMGRHTLAHVHTELLIPLSFLSPIGFNRLNRQPLDREWKCFLHYSLNGEDGHFFK